MNEMIIKYQLIKVRQKQLEENGLLKLTDYIATNDYKDFELKQYLEKIIGNTNPNKEALVDNMSLIFDEINTDGSYHFNLSIDATLYDRYERLDLPNVQIKKRTYDKLKEDQAKHDFTYLDTLIADILERHYEND